MIKETVGPAFPSDSAEFGAFAGMSLRDYFAAKALPWAQQLHAPQQYEYAARDAYKYADAMLAERNK